MTGTIVLDSVFSLCYNIFDNLITHFVADAARRPYLLNKITG